MSENSTYVLNYHQQCESMHEYYLENLQHSKSFENTGIICLFFGTEYELQSYLGSGAEGFVFKATSKQHGTVAIKFIDTWDHDDHSWVVFQHLTKIVKQMNELLPSHLIAKTLILSDLLDIRSHNDYKRYFIMVMEYTDGESLKYYLKKHIKSSLKQEIFAEFMTCKLLNDLSTTLMTMYDNPRNIQLTHNDIKSSNIWMNINSKVTNISFKLLDIGTVTEVQFLSNFEDRRKWLKYHRYIGTPGYEATLLTDLLMHEQIEARSYFMKYPQISDMYSTFITAMEMYLTLCDPNGNNSACQQTTINSSLDINLRHRNLDKACQSASRDCFPKQINSRLKQIKSSVGSIFSVLQKYLMAVIEYDNEDNEQFFSWSKFRTDLDSVCDEKYKNNDMHQYKLWINKDG
eukprot:542804_1